MTALQDEMAKPYFVELTAFVNEERTRATVYPAESDVYSALKLTPLENVRVVILGQDPYHGPRQAHGLCFSVQRGVAIPPSLRNIFQELRDDLGVPLPKHGNLEHWAKQGVLLLNATLTVRAGEAGSHQKRGWETFTDRIIEILGDRNDPLVFVLWGAYARSKKRLIDPRHTVIESAHPSPLSAHNGFFGSRPFSKINEALTSSGSPPIEWSLPVE
jgi:uracil-DNA glycosylase